MNIFPLRGEQLIIILKPILMHFFKHFLSKFILIAFGYY